MSNETDESMWLDAGRTLTEDELARICHLSVAEVEELVEYGLLMPLAGRPSTREFSAACVHPLRQAGALRERFDLDLFALGLMFSQLEHIARLERQLHSLHAHLPRPGPVRDGPAPWREPHG